MKSLLSSCAPCADRFKAVSYFDDLECVQHLQNNETQTNDTADAVTLLQNEENMECGHFS